MILKTLTRQLCKIILQFFLMYYDNNVIDIYNSWTIFQTVFDFHRVYKHPCIIFSFILFKIIYLGFLSNPYRSKENII